MIIDITAQGAVGDGKKVNTAEIQVAIDMCHEAGGGTVLIPKGNYISGTVFLKSNVTLEVAAGGVITGKMCIITDTAMRKPLTGVLFTQKIRRISKLREREKSTETRRLSQIWEAFTDP